MLKRQLYSYRRWIPAVIIMVIIFSFSHETAEVSSQTSGAMTNVLRSSLEKIWLLGSMTDGVLDTMEYLVRKLAHLTEYALLGISLCYALLGREKYQAGNFIKVGMIAIVLSAFYAVTDEFHQLFIPGRSGQLSDVFVDTLGALIGVVFYFISIEMASLCIKYRSGVALWSKRALSTLVTLYATVLFVIYPLYYDNGYFNMGEAKYQFVKSTASSLFPLLLILGAIYYATRGRTRHIQSLKQLSLTDYMVLGYGLMVLLSYIHTPYKEVTLWGYEGWYMGLMSQLLFILLYYYTSRFFRWYSTMGYLVFVTATLTHIFAILHRFQIDPLGMYEGVSAKYYILFLSTIGQATWYSSYLCIVFPLGVVGYLLCKKPLERVVLGFYVVIGSASLVTQNSDSAFLALFFLFIACFLVCCRTRDSLLRFLEVVFLIGSSFVVIGVLQQLYPQHAIVLEPLSIVASQGMSTKCLVGLTMVCYYVIHNNHTTDSVLAKYNGIIKKCVLVGVVALVAGTIGLIILVTNGWLPTNFLHLETISYLNFNDSWGNSRGFSWKVCAHVWESYSCTYKLIGCGPDGFAAYAYEHHYEEITKLWDSLTLTNAHNEWFSGYLFTGLLGGSSYLGIFVTQFGRGIKYRKQSIIICAGTVCILCYVVHNFFCYQQIVCTPLIFVVMGVMEREMRMKIQQRNHSLN